MFQYATGLRLAHVHNTEVKIERSWFLNDFVQDRKYALNCFRIKEVFANNEEMSLFPTMPISITRKIIMRISSLFKTPGPYGLFAEYNLAFDPRVLSLPDNVALAGYWQSFKYFNDIRDILLEEFQPVEPLSAENEAVSNLIKETSSVSLHVRRGDYITNRSSHNTHGCCSLDYYHKSIAYLSERVKSPHFFIFSDDMEWVRQNLHISQSVRYIDHNGAENGWIDMMLMSHCKHNIIANSSFSWWAAWLNRNPDKIVIGPDKYYVKRAINKYTADLFPPEWVRL